MDRIALGYTPTAAAMLRAEDEARELIRAGLALSFCTGYTRETGRYVQLQTDQGWHPEPMWQEFTPEPEGFAPPPN